MVRELCEGRSQLWQREALGVQRARELLSRFGELLLAELQAHVSWMLHVSALCIWMRSRSDLALQKALCCLPLLCTQVAALVTEA